MNFTTLIILIFTAILAIGSVSKGLINIHDPFSCPIYRKQEQLKNRSWTYMDANKF